MRNGFEQSSQSAQSPQHAASQFMTGREFKNSKWCKQAAKKDAQRSIARSLPSWKRRVKNLSLIEKADQLWSYITSGQAAASDKLLVMGALLYLVSPIDLIPDVVPVIGFLDDIGVATFVLSYLSNKIAEADLDKKIVAQEGGLSGALDSDTETFARVSVEAAPLAYKFETLKEAARDLDAPEINEAIDALELKISEPFHQVIFAGRYNTGKSTLLNALLRQNVLPTGPVPTTKALTYIIQDDVSSLCSESSDGTITIHHGIDDLKDSGNATIKCASQISLFLPAECLRGGVCMIDSPGLEDPDFDHSRLTLEAVPRADAVVVVLDASVPLSAPEYEFVQDLLGADRERKLFIVLNKADKKTPEELAVVLEDVSCHLRNLNIEPRIFALSSREALNAISEGSTGPFPNEFLSFQDELLRFVQHGLSKERVRNIAARVNGLEENLRAYCKFALDLASQNEEERSRAISGAEKCRAEGAKAIEAKRELLEQSLLRAERRFQANLRAFFCSLETALWGKISEGSLEELKRTDLIGKYIKDETKGFVEHEMEVLHRELEAETVAASYDLQTSLHGLSIKLVPTLTEPIVKPGIIAPAVVILSFPFLGVLSWIYLCVAATFGRSAIETLFGSLLGSVGVTRIRQELVSQLEPKLREFSSGVEKAVNQHFHDLRAVIAQELKAAAESALGPAAILREVPGSKEKVNRIRDVLQLLK